MRKRRVLLGLLVGCALSAAAEVALEAPVDRWEDALPLGNGEVGALVWGGGDTLRLSLDRADYWHLSQNTVFANPAFNWTNLIVYASRDVEDRKRIFEGRVGDSTKLPGVRLELKFTRGVRIAAFRLDTKRANVSTRSIPSASPSPTRRSSICCRRTRRASAAGRSPRRPSSARAIRPPGFRRTPATTVRF